MLNINSFKNYFKNMILSLSLLLISFSSEVHSVNIKEIPYCIPNTYKIKVWSDKNPNKTNDCMEYCEEVKKHKPTNDAYAYALPEKDGDGKDDWDCAHHFDKKNNPVKITCNSKTDQACCICYIKIDD